jgi:hypothetical protein
MPPTDSPLRWRALRLPKLGHTDEEYEDAWAADPASGRFAVADGASESSFAALWARLLTEGFLAARRPRDLAGWLDEARQGWSAAVMGLELPWYAEIKRDEGAFATLLGLRIRRPTRSRAGRWQAVAVGDSCLVRVRNRRSVGTFPLRHSSNFGNQPALLGSRSRTVPPAQRCSGSLQPGDRLFLMTDALAQWFMRSHEQGARPWEEMTPLLSSAQPEAAFASWIDGLRSGGVLHNDDVTLLSIELASAPEE